MLAYRCWHNYDPHSAQIRQHPGRRPESASPPTGTSGPSPEQSLPTLASTTRWWRYCGNKETLLAAAAELDLNLPDLSALPRSRLGVTLVDHFLHRWERDGALAALLRAAMTNPAAAARMQQIFADQLAPRIAGVCRDPEPAGARATLVAAQLLGFGLCRYVLRLPAALHMHRTR